MVQEEWGRLWRRRERKPRAGDKRREESARVTREEGQRPRRQEGAPARRGEAGAGSRGRVSPRAPRDVDEGGVGQGGGDTGAGSAYAPRGNGSGSGWWSTSGCARIERTTEAESGRGSCYTSSCRRVSPIQQFPLARARVPRPLGGVTVEEGGRNGTVEVFNSKTWGSGSGFHLPRRRRGRSWVPVVSLLM